jgi:hypothetical protein
MVHYGAKEIAVNVRKIKKKIYWTYLLIWRSLKVALNKSNYLEIHALNYHKNYLESYVLSQSTKLLATNI